MLWIADMFYRALLSARTFHATVRVLRGGVVRVDVATRGRVRVGPGQFAYVQIPDVSRVEWHPLTLVCAPGAPLALSFLVRDTGDDPRTFGARIGALANSDKPLRIRLDGPFGGCPLRLHRYTSVLLVAGGVGITPFASIAQYLLELVEHEQADRGSCVRAVTLLWTVRDAHAAEAWLPGLLPALRASGVFRVVLAVTGKGDTGKLMSEMEDGGRSIVRRGRPDVEEAVALAVVAMRVPPLSTPKVALGS